MIKLTRRLFLRAAAIAPLVVPAPKPLDLADLVMKPDAWANYVDNRYDDTTRLWVSLLTANGEADFDGYARQGVVRSMVGWLVEDGLVQNAEPIDFPACTGGACTIIGLGIHTRGQGGAVLFDGPVSPHCHIGGGTIFRLAPRQLSIDVGEPVDDDYANRMEQAELDRLADQQRGDA